MVEHEGVRAGLHGLGIAHVQHFSAEVFEEVGQDAEPLRADGQPATERCGHMLTDVQVRVVEYDAGWTTAFGVAAEDLTAALGTNLIGVHHIGSTSVPGLWAKPVIDMLAVVPDLAGLDALSPASEQLGYEAMGEFGITGRRYFRRNNLVGQRTHQLHAFADGSPHIRRHLAFRDYLRAHDDVAAEYATLKRRLADQHPNDVAAYMDGKNAFIKRVEARALACAVD